MGKIKWYTYGDVEIGFVKYNNKTRKGDYVIVKKGNKRKTFRREQGAVLGDYYRAFKGGLMSKRLGIKKVDKSGITRAEIYRRKVGKAPPIDSIISKGITTVNVSNIHLTSINQRRYIYKQMLGELVKDKDLLGILSEEENIKKIKHRIEIKLEMKDIEGNPIANFRVYGRTVSQVALDLQEHIKGGNISSEDMQKLRGKKYNISVAGEYKTEWRQGFPAVSDIQSIKSEVTFVKGR